MKGFLNRFFALVCCFSLTFGAFAYRAPKAKAVFTEPAVALGCALLTSVIVGTTANLVFTDAAKETIGYAIDGLVTEYLDTVGDVASTTADNFFSIIASGPKLLTTGAILLSKEAGELIGRFIAWLQTEKGLEAGGEALSVSASFVSPLVDGDYLTWNYLDSSSIFHRGDYWPASSFDVYFESIDTRIRCVDTGSKFFDIYLNNTKLTNIYYSNTIGFYYIPSSNKAYLAYVGASTDSAPGTLVDITSYVSDLLSSLSFLSFSLQPKSDLQTIPQEIPDGQAMVIAGIDGITLDDQSVASNAIFDAVLAGTLSPTVTVEDVATDIPATDTDTDTSILSWVKKIWQVVTDIPAAIGEKLAAIPAAVADAIAAVFAPDAALINEMSTTFNEKFGFLETLHTVGNDLLNMDAETAPPVVYIHLENAEGGVVWGGTEKALDMSWYQRYKADVDAILSGFLWVAFLWLLFKRAPDILAGAGLVERESSDIYMADAPDDLGGFFARHKRH